MQKYYKFRRTVLMFVLSTGLECAQVPLKSIISDVVGSLKEASVVVVDPKDLVPKLLIAGRVAAGKSTQHGLNKARNRLMRKCIRSLSKRLEDIGEGWEIDPGGEIVFSPKVVEGISVGAVDFSGPSLISISPFLCQRINKFEQFPKISVSKAELLKISEKRPNMSIGLDKVEGFEYKSTRYLTNYSKTSSVDYIFKKNQWNLITESLLEIEKSIMDHQTHLYQFCHRSIEYNNDDQPYVTKDISLLGKHVYLNIKSPLGLCISIPMHNLQATDIDPVNHTCKIELSGIIAEQDGQ